MLTLRGLHPVREALRSEPQRIRKLVLAEGPLDPKRRELVALARREGVPVYREARERLSRLGGSGPHQGVVAELSDLSWMSLEALLDRAPSPQFLLALDQVEDPRNFGAVARAADGAGVQGILLPERRSAPPSEVAIAASAGALLHARLARARNLADALSLLKRRGLWIVGLSPEAEMPWYGFDFTMPVAVVLGSEGKGLRKRVAAACDAIVGLPQLGHVQSLNLSVAAGVVLYEVVRQRGRARADD